MICAYFCPNFAIELTERRPLDEAHWRVFRGFCAEFFILSTVGVQQNAVIRRHHSSGVTAPAAQVPDVDEKIREKRQLHDGEKYVALEVCGNIVFDAVVHEREVAQLGGALRHERREEPRRVERGARAVAQVERAEHGAAGDRELVGRKGHGTRRVRAVAQQPGVRRVVAHGVHEVVKDQVLLARLAKVRRKLARVPDRGVDVGDSGVAEAEREARVCCVGGDGHRARGRRDKDAGRRGRACVEEGAEEYRAQEDVHANGSERAVCVVFICAR